MTNWSEKFYDIKQHFDQQVEEMQQQNVSVQEVVNYLDYLHAKLKPEQQIKNGSTIGTDSQLVSL